MGPCPSDPASPAATRRVLKFGGAALRDGSGVRDAVDIVRAEGGARPVVVVSAHEGVTEWLERSFERALGGALSWDPLRIRHRTLLRQLELPEPLLDRELRELRGTLAWIAGRGASEAPDPGGSRRLRDLVLSFGERLSARVFAAALRQAGIDATPVDAHDLGLAAERRGLGPPGRSRAALLHHLARVPGVPVVTGFFAVDPEGHLAILGRNGSDLTATWLGALLGAEEVQLWKRVPGILSADPTLVPSALPIPELGWEEAEAVARHGSGVLHPETLAPVKDAGVVLRIRDLDHPASAGTRIAGEASGTLALAHRDGMARLEVPLGTDRARQLARLFDRLAAFGVEPYLAAVRTTRVEVLVPEGPALERLLKRSAGELEVHRGLATVALLGAGAARSHGARERRRRAIALALEHGGETFAPGDEPHDPWPEAPSASGNGEEPLVLLPSRELAELLPRLHAAFLGE